VIDSGVGVHDVHRRAGRSRSRTTCGPKMVPKAGPRRIAVGVAHFAGIQGSSCRQPGEPTNHLGHSTVAASLRYQHMVSGRDVEIAYQLSTLATNRNRSAVTLSR
jgi:hypothetical protein